MAFLHGLPFPPLATCRVLEIGCGDAGHLLPIAADLPSASFVGFDLSTSAIAKGRSLAQRAELGNVQLHEAAVENFEPEGQFDYIIAHGLYSWVPSQARDAILRLCGQCLSPDGIAYVSYNVYPGQKVREVARDFMQMHAGSDVQGALAGLRLAASARSDTNFYTLGLAAEWNRLSRAGTHLVAHDALTEVNHPVYFRDFATYASAQGLHFLSEAQFPSLQDASLERDARAFLGTVHDSLVREQYRDFFRGTSYRESLLARHTGFLDRRRFSALWLGCALQVRDGEFVGENGAKVAVDHPFARKTLDTLCEAWPARLPFPDLAHSDEERSILAEMVLRMTRPGVLDCELEPWPYATRVSERPLATALARVQALSGKVTSLRHTSVSIDDAEACRFLMRLDRSPCSGPILDRLLRLSLLVK